ncbi:MAG TPA: hypothetical protein VKD24_03505 [Candidatus Angelobacter sp.]|nr:hypothetical protein [Candidatus Angelobacter sp.]
MSDATLPLSTWIEFGALILQTGVLIGAGIWQLGRMEIAIREEIATHKLENEEKINLAIRNVGETYSAVREKIREVELYMRDNYMRRDSFQMVVNDITQTQRQLTESINTQFRRLENKIEKAN